jgi:two-component system sensor histidine kinase PilS (NtrC family)
VTVVEPDPASERRTLSRRLRWLLGLRLLVALLFLGGATALAAGRRSPFPLTPLFVLVGLTCLLSLAYLALLGRWRRVDLQCRLQLGIDAALVTALVFSTGGLGSPFSFVYIFPVLAAAILLPRLSSLLLAGASSLLYGLLVNVQWHPSIRWAPLAGGHDLGYAVFQTFVHSIAFFLVALLGSHLAQRLNEAGRELAARRIDLRNLQSLHRDIVASIPSGIVTFDLEGRIVSCNPAAERILGLPARELHDRHWQASPFQRARQLEGFFAAPGATFEGHPEELEIRRRDGRAVLVGIALRPLTGAEGRLLGLVGVFQDLTERRRIEARLAQADRLAAVGRLAAGLAHEVRNPLAAISGSIQLIKEEGVAARPQLLDIVLREAERLKLVTGQFLDFARPPAARETACDLGQVLRETVSLLERARDGGEAVSISLDTDGGREPVVADPDQLKQVFWNLGLNALQAMPGGGRLTIAVRRDVRADGGEWTAVEFTDTGAGVPPPELERIFEPFYTTKRGGTGLGLAIARKIVHALGGRIEVANGERSGATFRVLLRQMPAEGPAG